MGNVRRYELYHVDAFTRTRLAGNSAGVVPEATGLDESEMLAVAAELRHSETAFVLPPDGDDHDVVVRFFTPTTEVPSCGHATLATHFALAARFGLKEGTVRQKCGAGILRIDLEPSAGSLRVRMHQGRPAFVRELSTNEVGSLIEALGIGAGDRNPECPVEVVDTGHSKVLFGVRDSAVLNRIVPDSEALKALSREIECKGFHVFTLAAEPTTHRMPHVRSRDWNHGGPRDGKRQRPARRLPRQAWARRSRRKNAQFRVDAGTSNGTPRHRACPGDDRGGSTAGRVGGG